MSTEQEKSSLVEKAFTSVSDMYDELNDAETVVSAQRVTALVNAYCRLFDLHGSAVDVPTPREAVDALAKNGLTIISTNDPRLTDCDDDDEDVYPHVTLEQSGTDSLG